MGFWKVKDKNVRKVLILSLIVMSLCVVSIVGVTLALFTSGDDGTIGINVTSGTVEIDILDTDFNSIVGEKLSLMSEQGSDVEIRFEPGATYCTQGFIVSNESSIPIKYHLYISDEAGEALEGLGDAFEFWITDDPVNFGLDDSQRMDDSDFYGELEKETMSEPFFLVIRMKSDANNDYQGVEFQRIGITVCGVQGNFED